MRRMRARWVVGITLLGVAALSCGGTADGLCTQPSSNAGGAALNPGDAGHAGERSAAGAGSVNARPSNRCCTTQFRITAIECAREPVSGLRCGSPTDVVCHFNK